MRKAKNNMYYYTVDDITAIVNGAAMGTYHSGKKRHIEKNYISVLLTRFKNEEEAAGNFNDDYRKPLLIKNGTSQVGRPKYEYTSYYVDKVLNYLSQTDEDSLDISFAAKNIIKNNTLTRTVINKIFKDVLQEKNQPMDSEYDSKLQVIDAIYRKDRANRKKLLTQLDKIQILRNKNYNMLDKYFHEVKKNMNSTYEHLKNPKIKDMEKLNELQALTNLNNSSFDKNMFTQSELEMLGLISKSALDNESLIKIFNRYKRKRAFIISYSKEQEIIFQIMEKDIENQQRLKVKIMEFTKESIELLSEKQGQIDMLFSYINTISDFINNENIDLLNKLKLSFDQLKLWKG